MRTLIVIVLCAMIAALAVPVLAAEAAPATPNAAPKRVLTSIIAPPVPDNTLTAREKTTGWKLLFDGKTFDGWGCTDKTPGGWVIDKGAMLYTVKGGGYQYSDKTYGNFELKIDFMVDKGANSGIFFRWAKIEDPVQTGFEMQLLDSADKKEMDKHDCGALYDAVAPSLNAMQPALAWNTAEIKCVNNMVTIRLNGQRVVLANLDRWTEAHKNPDGTPNKYDAALKDWARSGHIGLQAHGAKVWFKNIKVREL